MIYGHLFPSLNFFSTRDIIKSFSLIKTIKQSPEKLFWGCAIAVKPSRQIASWSTRKVLSYDCGFNSYYVPRTAWGVFTYFILFYYQKSFIKWIKQYASYSWGNRLKCLAQGYRRVLEGEKSRSHVTWFSLSYFFHAPCCPLGLQ